MAKKEVSRTFIFESMPVYKAILTLAIPNVVNQLANVIYNLADTFYIGQLNNSSMVAALTISAFLMLILTACSNLFCVGSCAVIASALGAGNKKKAEDVATLAPIMAFCLGFIIVLMELLFTKQIALYSGASETSLKYAMEYQFWVFGLNAIPFLCATTLGAGLRGRGYSKYEMYGITLGNILNIILDPIFIFVFDLGVTGAASATFVSTVASLIFFIFMATKMQKKEHLYTSLKEFKFSISYVWQVITTGFPAFLHSFLSSLVNTVQLNVLKGYSDAAVASLGIGRKVEHTFGQVIIGLNHGIIPIVAYNRSNGNYSRLKEVHRKSIILVTAWGIISVLLIFPLAKQIVQFFINDPDTISFGIPLVRMYAFLPLTMGFNNNTRTVMQALGEKKTSSMFSILRIVIIYLPLMFLLDKLFGFYGNVFTPLAADMITNVIAFFVIRKVLEKINKEIQEGGLTKNNT